MSNIKIAIASDHAGFSLKEELVLFLTGKGLTPGNFGAFSAESADYPIYAKKLCINIQNCEFDCGILVCGTGLGMSIAANKFKGIRCALCSEPVSAVLAKQHNNANVLALGARIIGADMAKAIVGAWLGAEFSGARHEIRLRMISGFEGGGE
ncbi:MAG: ribose 5-phosphate isomerase B [Oscillospiraceae bacterium]|jgi:ribose 5-phosphate isomerase B|nr:ribose 5-phosphate isomerase B [Oscillospiraceae bacterium]